MRSLLLTGRAVTAVEPPKEVVAELNALGNAELVGLLVVIGELLVQRKVVEQHERMHDA